MLGTGGSLSFHSSLERMFCFRVFRLIGTVGPWCIIQYIWLSLICQPVDTPPCTSGHTPTPLYLSDVIRMRRIVISGKSVSDWLNCSDVMTVSWLLDFLLNMYVCTRMLCGLLLFFVICSIMTCD